jgi:hypothetical protein
MSAKAASPESGPGPVSLGVAPAIPAKNGIDEAGPTATLHQLAEHITAIGSYVAAACRLHEVEPVAVFASHAGEILSKAMAQVHEAGRAIHELHAGMVARDIVSPADARSADQSRGGPYRVHFLNEFARANSVMRACQRTITILTHPRARRRSREEALRPGRAHRRLAASRTDHRALEVAGAETYLSPLRFARRGCRPRRS